jgi:coenzyme F420-reducing hydrogenase delta subunit/NAD-dependent dihydropyrimidine dehydrogenase PreA subunit
MTDLSKLEKWRTALNKCIRCGYCYDQCPIFKETGWEIDSPRGKLILLYGLSSGELEPSDYVANKLFECFHCNRCEKACSSGVPIGDIYGDARAYFLESGYDVVGTTSVTDHDVCARCLNCIRMCKHEARSFVDGKVVTDLLKCQSCGSCLDICPEKGISIQRGFGTNPNELLDKVDAFFNNARNPEAKAIVFSCGYSSYPGLQHARYDKFKISDEYEILITACSGRLKSHTVLETFERGAWGVLICCCPEDECEHGGSPRVKERMKSLTKTLERIGIDPKRLQVVEVPQGNVKKFTEAANSFIEEIRVLGPLMPERELVGSE